MSADATYADLEIRILDRQPQGYPVELTLDGERQFARGFLDPSLLPWAPGVDPEADGERLFAWLFGDETLKLAWAKASGLDMECRLRLRIDGNAPELHVVPWELLCQPASAGVPALQLAANSKTPFSRYLAVPAAPGRPLTAARLKVLVAVADATDLLRYRLASIDREQELAALQAATAGLPVELIPLDGPCTLAAIEAALRQGCHFLHFVGHGAFRADEGAVLFLAGDDNQVRLTRGEELAAMVSRLTVTEGP
ncbi:MAG TPA: CHAT domain-containing protein, partial [Anaerolineae bacterium]|nr:CHAT domain-containing protein [Anaerolineae bacterium]